MGGGVCEEAEEEVYLRLFQTVQFSGSREKSPCQRHHALAVAPGVTPSRFNLYQGQNVKKKKKKYRPFWLFLSLPRSLPVIVVYAAVV